MKYIKIAILAALIGAGSLKAGNITDDYRGYDYNPGQWHGDYDGYKGN